MKKEELLKKVIVEVYKEADPPVDLSGMSWEQIGERVYYPLHYIDQDKLDNIVGKYCLGRTKVVSDFLKVNTYLGISPVSRDFTFELIREDGLVKKSNRIQFVEYDQDTKKFKSFQDFPKLGYSLMMSPFTDSFTWLTTEITEIENKIEDMLSEDGFKFKTKNSKYTLYAKHRV